MNTCHICGNQEVVDLLDLGMQPISNRFLDSPSAEEYSHPIVVGQCSACGLVQISRPVPAEELKPLYDWITYREPEGHLDTLADTISKLPGINRDAAIGGISFKDDPLLERMQKLGLKNTWRLDPETDLGISDRRSGVETIQSHLTQETAASIAQIRGKADIIIARHILEHAYDTLDFAAALRELATPEGYIILEVPDCERSLAKCDYTTIWEEHIIYFTPETFRNSFSFSGLSLIHFDSFPYPFENSLVGIGQCQKSVTPTFPSDSILENEKSRFIDFDRGLSEQRQKLKNFFSEYRQNQGKIALMGAGHLCCAFITFLELDGYFEFVADDNPNKQGLFMPSSRLPIYNSAALLENDIKLCLLSLSPDSETKVLQNNQAFLEKGGKFASIFPASKLALKI